MLQNYGTLKSFHLVKETGEQQSRGFAFCEFANDQFTENALNMLNGTKLGTRTLTVRRTGLHQ